MNRPKVNFWATLFFVLNFIGCFGLLAWAIKDAWFPSELVLAKHPEPTDTFYLFNKTLAYVMIPITIIYAFPAWLLLSGKRGSWVWTTLLAFTAVSILNNPLIFIVLLIFWVKDENRDYYKNTGSQPGTGAYAKDAR